MGVETLAIMAVAGTAISAYGSYKEGQDAAEASRYNAQVARQNATLAEQSGALEAQEQRDETRSLLGTQKAGYARGGVEFTGSPLVVSVDSAVKGELDAQVIEYNTKVKSMQYLEEATHDETLATKYERAGYYKSGSTLLSQGSKLYTDYYYPSSNSKTSKTTNLGY